MGTFHLISWGAVCNCRGFYCSLGRPLYHLASSPPSHYMISLQPTCMLHACTCAPSYTIQVVQLYSVKKSWALLLNSKVRVSCSIVVTKCTALGTSKSYQLLAKHVLCWGRTDWGRVAEATMLIGYEMCSWLWHITKQGRERDYEVTNGSSSQSSVSQMVRNKQSPWKYQTGGILLWFWVNTKH